MELFEGTPLASDATASPDEPEARLVLEYSPEGGVVLRGTERGDAPGIKRVSPRFRWSRREGFWYVPKSRGGRLRTEGEMSRVQADLARYIGEPVALDYQRSERSAQDLLEQRQEAAERAQDRREARAERAEAEAAAAVDADARASAALPPWGEPVKVDHYSAKRHMRDLERAHQAMGKRSTPRRRNSSRATSRRTPWTRRATSSWASPSRPAGTSSRPWRSTSS